MARKYVQATPDLMMGDLLKNMRASQIFSVCGLPENAIRRVRDAPRPSPGTSSAGEFEDSVWDHLAGSVSTPFEAGEHRQIAVEVIDDRGNELMVVKSLQEAQR